MLKKAFRRLFLCVAVLTIALSGIGIFSGCASGKKYNESIKLTGDLESEVSFNSFKNVENAKSGKANFSDILDTIKPLDPVGEMIVVGGDGISALTSLTFAEKLTLYYDKDLKWCIDTDALPAPIKIKGIVEIIFVATNSTEDIGGVISTSEIHLLSRGNLLKTEFEAVANRAEKNEYYVDKLNRLNVFDKINLTDFAPLNYDNMYIYTKDYDIIRVLSEDKGGYIKLDGENISYYNTSDKVICEDVYGIATDSEMLNTDIYTEVKESVIKGKTLVIEIDGLYFDQYRMANVKLGGTIKKSLSVNPSISNVNLATLLTGKTPKQTGIISRSSRDINANVETIFDVARANQRSIIYLEGNSTLINTDPNPILSTAGEGVTTDDNIYNKAMNALNQSDFIFVHFHTVDDFNHNFSSSSSKTEAQVNKILGYTKALADAFSGTVYVVSDHGTISYTDGGVNLGKHGNFAPSVMYIPFIKVK